MILSLLLARCFNKDIFSFYEYSERLLRIFIPIFILGQDVIVLRNLQKIKNSNKNIFKYITSSVIYSSIIYLFGSILFVLINFKFSGNLYGPVVYYISAFGILISMFLSKFYYFNERNIFAVFIDGVYHVILSLILVFVFRPENILEFSLFIMFSRLSVFLFSFFEISKLLDNISINIESYYQKSKEGFLVGSKSIIKRFYINLPIISISFVPFYIPGDFELVSVIFRIALISQIFDQVQFNLFIDKYSKLNQNKVSINNYFEVFKYAIPILLVIVFFGDLILDLWNFNSKQSFVVLVLVSLGQFLNAFQLPVGSYLFNKQKDLQLLRISLFSFVIIFITNIVLYYFIGIYSFAIALIMGKIFELIYVYYIYFKIR